MQQQILGQHKGLLGQQHEQQAERQAYPPDPSGRQPGEKAAGGQGHARLDQNAAQRQQQRIAVGAQIVRRGNRLPKRFRGLSRQRQDQQDAGRQEADGQRRQAQLPKSICPHGLSSHDTVSRSPEWPARQPAPPPPGWRRLPAGRSSCWQSCSAKNAASCTVPRGGAPRR